MSKMDQGKVGLNSIFNYVLLDINRNQLLHQYMDVDVDSTGLNVYMNDDGGEKEEVLEKLVNSLSMKFPGAKSYRDDKEGVTTIFLPVNFDEEFDSYRPEVVELKPADKYLRGSLPEVDVEIQK